MRAAFRPSAQRQRDSILTAGTYDARQLRHLVRALELKGVVQHARDSLAGLDLVGEGSLLAAAYLPAGETARRGPPSLAFGIFEPGGYGDRDGITMDVLFSLERGKLLVPILGHEVHHYHTGFLTRLQLPDRAAPEYRLLQALRNLANEGTADRINLIFPVGTLAVTAEAAPAYNHAYDNADSTLRAIDSLLASAVADPAVMKAAAAAVSNQLVYAGHPVGAYMAMRIETVLGREPLVAAVGNPFAFLRLFQRAEIRARGQGPFRSSTLGLVDQLEKQFTGGPAR